MKVKVDKNGKVSYVKSLSVDWCSLIPGDGVDDFSRINWSGTFHARGMESLTPIKKAE